MAQSVLVVAPHPDDEAIGCGGAICLHVGRGDTVHVVFLTSGERGMKDVPAEAVWSIREAEAHQAGDVLGVSGIDFLRLPDAALCESVESGARRLRAVLEARAPEIVYLPHPEENHPDHQAALPLVRAALAPRSSHGKTAQLRAYEVWSPMTQFHWVEDVSDVFRQKLRAVRCYRSQIYPPQGPPFRYDRAVRGLNQYRGVMAAGSRYAEAFRSLEN